MGSNSFISLTWLPQKSKSFITQILTIVTYTYCVGLCSWVILNLFFGDRWWWLFLLNTFAIYLFIPLPLLLIFAIVLHKREIWLSFGFVLVLAIYFYGALFIPKLAWYDHSSDREITVMTYNVLGFNEHYEEVVSAIKIADVDVIAIQELNSSLAQRIKDELMEYPYQILHPQEGVCGIGIISRYPLAEIKPELPNSFWCGASQILEMTFAGEHIIVINFHAIPPGSLSDQEGLEWTVREREHQAQMLIEFVKRHPKPLLVLGDLNASEQSVAYKTITALLSDAWRDSGWGVGHTFPGADSPGSSRPRLAGFLVPMWLVRIDYIFYSDKWWAKAAWIGPWDGASDHRPVVAKLAYKK